MALQVSSRLLPPQGRRGWGPRLHAMIRRLGCKACPHPNPPPAGEGRDRTISRGALAGPPAHPPVCRWRGACRGLVNTSTWRAPTRNSSPWHASMTRVSDLPPTRSGVMLKVTSSLALDHGWPASVLPANKQQRHARAAADRENLFLSLCLRASVFCSSASARCHSPARLFAPSDSRR